MSTSFRRSPSLLIPFLVAIACWSVSTLPAYAGPGQWTPVGPGAGDADAGCLTIHPALPGAIWACLPHSGLYRSADRGATWRWTGPYASGWNNVSVAAADPSRPNALWAVSQSEVFHSEDGGLHWQRLPSASYSAALSDAEPFSMASVAGTLYVAASKRLLASSDSGSTWRGLYGEDNGRIEAFAASPARPADLYIAGHASFGAFFLRSSDAGATWEDLTDRLFPQEGIRQLAATPTALYAFVGGSIRSLFRSTDRGATWFDILLGGRSAPAWVSAWTFDPRAPRTLYVFGSATDGESPEYGLWVSRDEGATWRKAGELPISPNRLEVDSASGVLYAQGNKSLARSLDGGATWKIVLRVPDMESSCAQVSFQPQNPAGLDLVIGWTAWRSLNGGRSWGLKGSPSGIADMDSDPEDPARKVAVGGSYAYLSENGGATWRRTTSGLWYVESLTRVDRRTLLAAGAGLYRSGDNGETWRTVLPGWTQGSEEGRWAQKIEVDPGDPSKIYALTFLVDDMELPHDPLVDYPSILWKSVDGGQTWRKIARNLRAFALDRGSSRLFGVRNRDLLESADEGRTWRKVARTRVWVWDLAVDSGAFYAASLGVWRSLDGGTTWQRLAGEWGRDICSLTLRPTDPRTLYIAYRWGVFELTVPE